MYPLKKFTVALTALMFSVYQPAYAKGKASTVTIEKGKLVAKNCVDCHASPGAALAGPLKGIRKIRTAGYIYSLMKNPMRFADEHKTAKKVFAKRGLQIPPFPDLSIEDIKANPDYFDRLPNNKIN